MHVNTLANDRLHHEPRIGKNWIFSFFLLSSSARLARHSVSVSPWFTHKSTPFCGTMSQFSTSAILTDAKINSTFLTECSITSYCMTLWMTQRLISSGGRTTMWSIKLMYWCSMMIVSIKKHCIKLKGEVGMAMPKSTRTRVVGISTYMVHPCACFQVTTCNIPQLLLLFFTHFLIIIW